MSRYYDFQCTNCGWVEERYANSSRCRHCGMKINKIQGQTKDEQIASLTSEVRLLREKINLEISEARRLRGVLLEAKVIALGAAQYDDLIGAKEVLRIISSAQLAGVQLLRETVS